jgi:hypothetical protein
MKVNNSFIHESLKFNLNYFKYFFILIIIRLQLHLYNL